MSGDGAKRFACTACGRCCDRGPEMELGEASALAGTFITSLLFRVHSLPLRDRPTPPHRRQMGGADAEPATGTLVERRAQLAPFTVSERVDRARGRSLHLTLSALTLDSERGRCPALAGDRCTIHPARPLTCRTVPLHYSRPPSTLAAYLDGFAATPGYRCDVGPDAPALLDGAVVLDPAVREARDAAMAMAEAERGWKRRIVALMADEAIADAAGLPTLRAVLRHSDAGSASAVPMLAAWRVARDCGILSPAGFRETCEAQLGLIEAALAGGPDLAAIGPLLDMKAAYGHALARGPRAGGAAEQPFLSARP